MTSEPNDTNIPSSLRAELPALPTQREIDRYIAEGTRIKSEMIVGGLSRFWRWIVSQFRKAPAAEQAEPVANSLAAIRSAVEILRDTPDLDPCERNRFIEIVLREERRLEALLDSWRGGRQASA